MKSQRYHARFVDASKGDQHRDFEVNTREPNRKKRRLTQSPDHPVSQLAAISRSNQNESDFEDLPAAGSRRTKVARLNCHPPTKEHSKKNRTDQLSTSPLTSPPPQLLEARGRHRTDLTLLSLLKSQTPATSYRSGNRQRTPNGSPFASSTKVYRRVSSGLAEEPPLKVKKAPLASLRQGVKKDRCLKSLSVLSSSPLSTYRRSARRTRGQRLSRSFEEEQGDEVVARYGTNSKVGGSEKQKGNIQRKHVLVAKTSFPTFEWSHQPSFTGHTSSQQAQSGHKSSKRKGRSVQNDASNQVQSNAKIKPSVTTKRRAISAFRLTDRNAARKGTSETTGIYVDQPSSDVPSTSHHDPWDVMYSPTPLKILTSSSLPSPPGHSGEPSPVSDSGPTALRPFSTFRTPSPSRNANASSLAILTPLMDESPSTNRKKARIQVSPDAGLHQPDIRVGIVPLQERFNEGYRPTGPRGSALKKKHPSPFDKEDFDLEAALVEAGTFLENWDIDTALRRASATGDSV